MFHKILIWVAMGTAGATWLGACGLLFLASAFQSHPLWLFQTIQTFFYLTSFLGSPVWAFYSFRWGLKPLGIIFSSVVVLFLTNLTFLILKISVSAGIFFAFDIFILVALTVFAVKGWERFKVLVME